MSTRKVIGTIRRIDGSPRKYAKVTFRRVVGSYTFDAQYPADICQVTTDSFGRFSCILWCNTESEAGETLYECLFEGDRFKFSLPVGVGDIDLSSLRAMGSHVNDPKHETVLEYINSQIALYRGGEYYQYFYPGINEKIFTLTNPVTSPEKSQIFLNGLKQQFGTDYNIDANLINWIAEISLSPEYLLEVYY
ncbi:MAG: hypothetical protein KME60_03265 [Cyanomargarita calcarea GSE-NOS-MK-12-04C]|jgi:hypothetical protein|uniref:Uncharacterized protein n=1 Tax=Cyanomargarita calcarea GSE-NOS-MK-12-04C TaxID=2839659 RepID=A0A951QL27_9CYAN|nr:hypothetical protein [Cyanomargarita calcarea GSE-NOS-MK-12-04C]